MKTTLVALALALAASVSTVSAQPVKWTRYTIPQTGTSMDFPSSIFTEEAGRPDGYGQRFRTADGRAELTIQAAPNLATIHRPPSWRRSIHLHAFSTSE